MNVRADDTLSYAKNFFGFGNENAPYLFIGLEEGGDAATIDARVTRWKELGSLKLVDIYEMHRDLPNGLRWFSDRPPIQATWGKLIRILLAAENRPSDREAVRNYQRDRLGRKGDETALIELMPLPSRTISEWKHSDSSLQELASRESYVDAFREERLKDIVTMISQTKRRGVVFYGRRREWPRRLHLTTTSVGRFDVSQIEGSPVVFCDHPTSHGQRNADFDAIGEWLRKQQ